MPKREDDFWASQKEGLRYCSKHKRYYRADIGCQLCWMEEHPGKPSPKLRQCPICQKISLFQTGENLFECLNIKCPKFQKKQSIQPHIKQEADVVGSPSATPNSSGFEDRKHVSDEESMKLSAEYAGETYLQVKEVGSDRTAQSSNRSKSIKTDETRQSGHKKEIDKPSKRSGGELPKWMIALLFVIALSIVGIGVSLFVGTFIPFWILFGFSAIFSVEKWFSYYTRKHKGIGKLYRLILNLSILSLLGLLIWSGIRLFSSQFTYNALVGSFIFLAEFIFFVWIWKVISKNSWRWPSMKLTVFSLICLYMVFAFAGVQPMADFKDKTITSISSEINKASTAIQSATATSQPPVNTPVAPKNIPPVSVSIQEPQVSAERLAFNLINDERVKAGLSPTVWDDNLYQLSKAHTQEMANRRQLFHSDMNATIGENAWGGSGYSRYNGAALAQAIVDSWMSSPLHRAWILNIPFQHSVVSIVSDSSGQYASWTFWTAEAGAGPPLVQKASELWQSETGGSIPWLTWLYDIKGYPNNQEFLRQLGIK